MDAREAVLGVYSAFPAGYCHELVTALSALDRYQASDGIGRAADLVADAAERAGLSEVEVRHYPADGEARWWTFRAPMAWTPEHASLDLLGPAGRRRIVSHPAQPYSLATYSAPIDEERVPLLDARQLVAAPPPWPAARGALALLTDALAERLAELLESLALSGARGVATDIPARRWRGRDEGGYASGRLELPRDSTLFGFSVPPAAMDQLLDAERAGVPACITVRVTRDADMPVVHGVLPGVSASGETLMTAHLCHPAPGANDNGSGVAALVGIATALNALDRAGRGGTTGGVRFLWAPEFAGMAAYLHEGGHLPAYVINLDMVGEDQARCGSPLTIERGPAHVPSFLPALAEDFVELLPTRVRSYSEAVPLRDWSWSAVPFSGASDHALFADRHTARPALAIGHWPDPYRHSSLDTPDKVSPDELRRTGALAGGMARFLRQLGPAGLAYVGDAVTRWALGQMLAIRRVAQHRDHAHPGEDAVFDPFAPAHIGGFLHHQADFAAATLPSVKGLQTGLTRQADLLASGVATAPTPEWPAPARRYWRRWLGPFNFEGLLDAAPPAGRAWLLSEDQCRPSAYTEAVALALALDCGTDLRTAVTQAAYSTWLPISTAFAERLLDVLESAAWTHSQSPARDVEGHSYLFPVAGGR